MNRMKQLKSWLSVICLVALATALAGCGGGSGAAATKVTALGTLTTATGTTGAAAVPVTAPSGVTVAIPANTTLKDLSGAPVTGVISTSVGYSTAVADLPAAAGTLPGGTSLAAFVDITMSSASPAATVKTLSNPRAITINVASSGAKTGDSLVVYSFDSGTGQWTFAGTEIVDANGNISPTVSHFSIWGAFKSATPPPVKPSGVQVTGGDTQATVSWSPVAGASSYNVYYGTSAGVTAATGTKVASSTASQVITGLLDGTTYFFVVTAVNAGGESIVSNEVNTTLITAPPSGITTSTGDTQVTINWNQVTGASSYNVYYGTVAGVTAATGTKVPSSTTTQVVTGLTDGTKYFFVVTAVDAGGESALSSEYSITPIGKPGGIQLATADGQVTISWTAVTGATSYNVYYGTSASITTATSTNKVSNAASGGQAITGLTNGTTYYFLVTAVNASGESGTVNAKSAIPGPNSPPTSPNGRAVTSTVAGQIDVSWTAVSGATSYNVYYLQSASLPTNAQVLAGPKQSSNTASLSVTGLTSGAVYYVLITAVNAFGESGTQTKAQNITVK